MALSNEQNKNTIKKIIVSKVGGNITPTFLIYPIFNFIYKNT